MPLKSLYDGVGYLTTTYMEVKKLVDENPEHITESDSFGMIPLHYASLYGAPLKIVKYLIQQDEISIERKTNNGSLPLHLAVMDNHHHHLLPYFLSLYPDGANIQNDDHLTPYDIAKEKNLRNTVVDNTNDDDTHELMELLEDPKLTIENYKNGKYWIYEGVGINSLYENSYNSDEHWENTSEGLINHLIKENPKHLSKQQKENGYLPIHYACFYKTDLDVVKRIVEGYEEGLKVKTDGGWIPLHMSAMQNQHHLLDYLILKYPASINQKDKKGKTALEYAIQYNKKESISILTMALGVSKTKRREFTDVEKRLMTGVYSLYSTSQRLWGTTTTEHLQNLIDIDPKLLSIGDSDHNRLPIHFALEYGAPSDICIQLATNDMNSLKFQDKYGCLPLHLCATWNRYDLIPYFITCYPESVDVQDKQGCTSLYYAQLYNRRESISLLSDVNLTIQTYREKYG
eukprot:g10521.t1